MFRRSQVQLCQTKIYGVDALPENFRLLFRKLHFERCPAMGLQLMEISMWGQCVWDERSSISVWTSIKEDSWTCLVWRMELEENEVEAWMGEPYQWLLARWSWKKLSWGKVAGTTYECLVSKGIQRNRGLQWGIDRWLLWKIISIGHALK